MSGSVFAEALLERVRQARASLDAALAAGDAYAIAVAEDELDDAVRVAHRHGVAVDAVEARTEGE
ncbi:hypothetical protein [Streptomyces lanatus]|uniref:Uncharacterized protein n=1 Tax=Streptomyces lanatus TaxID=66900 RepID=A0ABV1Y549_9ACTN|nr:hypothetical protein [Streptomyces lanatus]GHH28782.1 hypothetical protein GCM10018780_85860 [Streptomyces lanatus]